MATDRTRRFPNKGVFIALMSTLLILVFINMSNQKKTIRQFKNVNQISYEPFNTTNPFEDSWCPKSRCHNSPTCAPCNRRYLFIIATGRSGSTTLLKMFNQLPNVRLSGENWNVLYHASSLTKVFQSHPENFIDEAMVKEGRFMHKAVQSGPFQHNAMPVGSIACVIQSLASYLNPPPMDPEHLPIDEEDEAGKILGMKIIRFQQPDWKPQRAERFLRESFPCARFIINIRSDIEKQGKSVVSAFGKDDLYEAMESINSQTNFLKELAHRLGNNKARLIDMSKWKNDVSILNNIINWLGFKGCQFKDVIHENHDNYGSDSREIDLGKYCRLPNS